MNTTQTAGWRSQIDSASQRLAERAGHFLRQTPLWKLPASAFGIDASGAEIWLKLEHMQVSGSFKARGMMNRLLANDIPQSGVIVASTWTLFSESCLLPCLMALMRASSRAS